MDATIEVASEKPTRNPIEMIAIAMLTLGLTKQPAFRGSRARTHNYTPSCLCAVSGVARIECSLVYRGRLDAVIQKTIGPVAKEAQEMDDEATHFL